MDSESGECRRLNSTRGRERSQDIGTVRQNHFSRDVNCLAFAAERLWRRSPEAPLRQRRSLSTSYRSTKRVDLSTESKIFLKIFSQDPGCRAVAIRTFLRTVHRMQRRTLLEGLVTVWTLPQVQPGPIKGESLLKRVMLPQGELAQVHNSDEGMRYIAAIELKAGTVRGNHYHKIRREYVYVISGRSTLAVRKLESEIRESAELAAGNLVFIPREIVHALQVKEDGLAVEFSPDRSDPEDTYREALV